MAKLYMRYGTVGSAKTLNLLAVAHNYERQGKRVFVIKPAVDIRFGSRMVQSRTGLKREADLDISTLDDCPKLKRDDYHCVLVDECQFFSPDIIEWLREVAEHTPVICYGLRTDFKRELFPGSKRLMELADSIEEVKTVCQYCNKKAIYNKKLTESLEVVDLGTESKYAAVCAEHYKRA